MNKSLPSHIYYLLTIPLMRYFIKRNVFIWEADGGPSHWSLLKHLHGSGQSWELGTQSRSSKTVARTHLLEPASSVDSQSLPWPDAGIRSWSWDQTQRLPEGPVSTLTNVLVKTRLPAHPSSEVLLSTQINKDYVTYVLSFFNRSMFLKWKFHVKGVCCHLHCSLSKAKRKHSTMSLRANRE